MTAAPDVPSPTAPSNAPPAAPSPEAGFPLHRALPYVVASALLALSQGLGQGFVSANVAQYAGDLGVTTTEASWLLAAYLIPRASITLILIKIRTQYGLRRFAEIGTALYLAVAFASVWITDLRSAVVLQFLAGIASAPLSTLGFLYMLEPLPQQWKMRLGLPMVLVLLMSAPTLARVISPALVGDGGLEGIHLTTLALAMLSLVAVRLLPLRPVPHMKVIQPLDLLSFALIAFGFGGIATGFVMGPIHWWGDTAWIGWLLAASVAALALTVVIELHRPAPLLDIRWLVSPAMLHLTATLFLFRLLLSEQSTGAPRMFQALGVAPPQMTGLFAVICLASLIGGLACVAWMKPGREPQFHLAALLLIALGAFMDSHATVDTRPAQMMVSQALIGFAGMLFMPPAMLKGLMAALARGPNYLLSFVVVFLSSQSLGGVIGSGIFTTIINHRQVLHYQALAEQLQATDPGTMQAIGGGMAALAGQIPDAAARRLQAVSALAQDAATQAYVMAYNDAYFLTFLCAAGAAGLLLLHLLRDRLAARLTPRSPSDIQTAS